MSTDPNTHDVCLTDDCDCTCPGCTPKECKTCPHCGADIDNTPADGGVTDSWDSDSYQLMPVNTPLWDVPLRTAQLAQNAVQAKPKP